MIWIYILATLLAQGIVVALVFQLIDRKSSQAKEETPPQKESEKSSTPVEPTDVIGASGFSVEKFKEMFADVIRPVVMECVEAVMEAKDVQFEESKTPTTTLNARMSPQQEARVFEDYRNIEEKLESEDNSPTPPNTFASGADFDTLTKASMILQSDNPPTKEEQQIVMKVHRSIEGTEFSTLLPNNLLERMYLCHRNAEMKNASLRAQEPTDAEEVERIENSATQSTTANDDLENESDSEQDSSSTLDASIWKSFSKPNSKPSK